MESAAHRLHSAEAKMAGDCLDLLVRTLERDTRLLDANRLDVGGRRHVRLAAERTCEVARAHRGTFRERADRQVGGGVCGDPRLHLTQRLALRGWGGRLPG